MEILHTCTWLQQLYITHETKTDSEKSVKKKIGKRLQDLNFDVNAKP